jgi:DNA-binding PadR family transcriptional regulator
MNKTQVGDMEHALRNGNRFYTEADDNNWNELVEKGFATKHRGWEDDMAYFRVTNEGKEALKLTDYQIGKLKHCFGLDYSKKPYRNYYHCAQINNEWEDLCAKGYATQEIRGEKEIIYFGTLKGLREVYRRNVSTKYFEAI